MLGEGSRLQSSTAACSALQCAKSTESSTAHLRQALHLFFSRHPPVLLQSRIQQQQGKAAHTVYTQTDSSSLQMGWVVLVLMNRQHWGAEQKHGAEVAVWYPKFQQAKRCWHRSPPSTWSFYSFFLSPLSPTAFGKSQGKNPRLPE